jgi:hypothetical protein
MRLFKHIPDPMKFSGHYVDGEFSVELPAITKGKAQEMMEFAETLKKSLWAARDVQEKMRDAFLDGDVAMFLWLDEIRFPGEKKKKSGRVFGVFYYVDIEGEGNQGQLDILKYIQFKEPEEFTAKYSKALKCLRLKSKDITDFIVANVTPDVLAHGIEDAVIGSNVYGFEQTYDAFKDSDLEFMASNLRDVAFNNNLPSVIVALYNDYPDNFFTEREYRSDTRHLFGSGKDDCAMALLEEGMPIEPLFLRACENGRSEFVKYCHQLDSSIIERLGDQVVQRAIKSESPETMRYLYEQGADMSELFTGMIGAKLTEEMAQTLKEIFMPKAKKTATPVLQSVPKILKVKGCT